LRRFPEQILAERAAKIAEKVPEVAIRGWDIVVSWEKNMLLYPGTLTKMSLAFYFLL